MFSTVCLKFVLSPWLGLFPISFDIQKAIQFQLVG